MSNSSTTSPKIHPDRASASIARAATGVLTWGFRLSAALFLVGVALSLVQDDPAPSRLAPLSELLRDVASGRASGFFGLAILTVIVTPLITALVAVVNFARLDDWRYAVVAGVVLLLLGISIGMAIF